MNNSHDLSKAIKAQKAREEWELIQVQKKEERERSRTRIIETILDSSEIENFTHSSKPSTRHSKPELVE
ncbi:MAG: hypothetical protein WBM83_12475 [Flavobacteriaceae bacterium]